MVGKYFSFCELPFLMMVDCPKCSIHTQLSVRIGSEFNLTTSQENKHLVKYLMCAKLRCEVGAQRTAEADDLRGYSESDVNDLMNEGQLPPSRPRR